MRSSGNRCPCAMAAARLPRIRVPSTESRVREVSWWDTRATHGGIGVRVGAGSWFPGTGVDLVLRHVWGSGLRASQQRRGGHCVAVRIFQNPRNYLHVGKYDSP